MKKQFIAIILTVAMLVAMVPMFAVPAAAETVHNMAFVPADITVDGECDDVYTTFNSQPIKSVATFKDKQNEDLYFEGYAIANSEGIYVWMGIHGDTTYVNTAGKTLNINSEGLQIYYNMGASSSVITERGLIYLDYAGNVKYEWYTPSSLESETVLTDDGWVAELFIPWRNNTAAKKAIDSGKTDFFFALGFRYNDDYDGKSNYNCAVVDDDVANYKTSFSKIPTVTFETYDFEVEEEDGGISIDPNMRVTPYLDIKPTIDGSRDYLYAKGTKIVNISNHGTSGKKGNGEMFECYVVTTKEGFCVWTEVKDSTFLNQSSDSVMGDYLQLYYNMSADGTAGNMTTYGYVQFDYQGKTKFANYGSTGDSLSASRISLKISKNADGWVSEVFVPWRNNSAVKKAIEEGRTDFFFALGVQYNDDTNRATTDGGKPHRDDYYYDSSSGSSYWNGTSGYSKIPASQIVYFDGTPDVPVAEKINFSNVLTIGPNIKNPVMRYTLYGADGSVVKSTDVNGVGQGNNKYLFSFDIAPQYLSCSVTAELVYSGVILSTIAEQASVIDYYKGLLNLDPNDSGLSANQFLAMKYLIYHTLNYGAAAQIHTGYNLDNLANKGYEDKTFMFEGIDYEDIKTTEPLRNYDAELVSMGIHFDSLNRMYIKFTVDNIDNYKVTFSDGKPGIAQTLPVYEVANEANTYIAYTPAITPENYHHQYVIRLVNTEVERNDVVVQAAYCNVNAYLAKIIETSDDITMVNLAKAAHLYAEGVRSYLAS